MSGIASRIRPLRQAVGLGQTRFANALGVSLSLIKSVEWKRQRPTAELIEAICRTWPQFAYWLVTGDSEPNHEHISPQIEMARREAEE